MKKYLLPVIFLFFVLGVNLYFRAFPAYFPQFKTLARNTVEDKIVEQIADGIDKKYPASEAFLKEKLVEGELAQYRRTHKPQIDKQIRDEYLKLSGQYQDAQGQTYLMELDGWHWGRYVENIVRTGRPGDTVKAGKEIDALSLAPDGSPLMWNKFLFYFSAALYRGFAFFKPLPLSTFLFYLPLFFVALFIIALYIFSFRLAGQVCAMVSCLFAGLAPIFISRSCAGWFDTDVLNMLFPVLIIWMYLEAYRYTRFHERLLWAGVAGFFVGLFSFTWNYWWFILGIVAIYEAYSLVNILLLRAQHQQEDQDSFAAHALCLVSFIIFSFVWIIIFCGFEPMPELLAQIKRVILLNKPITGVIWPNVYSTVSELTKMDYLRIAQHMGGKVLFFAAFSCLLGLFLHCSRNPEYHGIKKETIALLTLWAIAMFFSCTRGVRFAMFLLVPLGVALGWALGEGLAYYKSNKKIVLLLVLSAGYITVQLVNSASREARSTYPLMTDSWHKVLVELRERTPKDATIDSWWDFGHWFKAVARRKVIFDGNSQNVPQAYWMANALMTGNEEEAVAILRMLNNGANKAFEIIDAHIKDPLKSVLLLKQVLLLGSQQANQELRKFLPPKETQEVGRLIFSKPGKAYFVVDYSMLSKSRSISFLANWNFIKVYLAENFKKRPKPGVITYLQGLGLDASQAQRLYQEAFLMSGQDEESWISWRLRFYGQLVEGRQDKGLVLFDNGLLYNPAERTAYVYCSQEAKYKVPQSLLFFEDGMYKELPYAANSLSFSVLIVKGQDGYRATFLDRSLGGSILTRMYFFNGAGLTHFKPFISEKSEQGFLRVFEIVW